MQPPALHIEESAENAFEELTEAGPLYIEPTIESTTTEPTLPESEPEPEPVVPVEVDVMAVELPSLCQRGVSGSPRQYRVLINEVAWMGSQNSPNDEWIELKNVWGIPVNLNGWQLQDKDQQIKIIFGESDAIPAGGYFLLERTEDYTGALNNNNEALYLFDNNCQLEDEIEAQPDWPAGDNSTKRPMQRFDVLYWYTGSATAGSENSPPPAILSHPSALAPTPTQASRPSYPRILITEVQIAGPNGQKDDFAELYNPNDQGVSLTGWYLQRKTETGQDFSSYAPVSLFSGKTIEAKNYFLVANASSSLSAELIDVITTYPLTENNILVLKNPNGDIADEIFTDSPSDGESFGRKWSDEIQSYLADFEIQSPTPRVQNQSPEEGWDEEAENDIIINEIAWMGTEASPNDEWIELYNNTDQDIDLTGWKLRKDNEDWIELADAVNPIILAQGYFLLERTDDDTVSDISADQIYTGALNNNGEVLELYDNLGSLIDSVDASDDWPAGNNQTKQTMERIDSSMEPDPDNWANNNLITRNGLDADGNSINGTPKAENSVSKLFTEIQTSLLTFDQNFILTYLGSPYLMDGSIKVSEGVKLTIEPGVIIKFKDNYYQHSLFTVEGQLEAVGVIFTSSSTEPSAGDWDGIYFGENSESILDNVIIRYADTVKIEVGEVTIDNSTIESSRSYGLWIINSSPQINNTVFLNNNNFFYTSGIFIGDGDSAPLITNSSFLGNKVGIWAENGANPEITGNYFENNETPIKIASAYPYFSGNSAENNLNGDGIFFSGILNQDENWQADLPYIIENSLTIAEDTELTIESGTVVKFNGGSKMLVEGDLLAQGEEENPIIFTSITDSDPENNGGYYIYFYSSSENSILENIVVRYGGAYINDFAGYRAAMTVEDTSLTISNSVVENNFFAGLYLNNSNSTIQNTIFRDNNLKYSDWGLGSYSNGLYLVNSSEVDLSGSHFERNYYGIHIEDINGDCPDLSDVTFGKGDNANTFDVLPDTCLD